MVYINTTHPTCQIAVARGHLCAVEALLESGANPRQVVEEDGRTLLDFAEHAARQQGASAAVMQIKQALESSSRSGLSVHDSPMNTGPQTWQTG